MYQRMESSDYQTVSQEESSQNDTMILLHEERLYVRKGETLKIDKIKKKSFIYRKLLLFLQKIQTIATHGIVKKTQKTPPKEIAKAEEIKKKYFELKEEMEEMKMISFDDFQDKYIGKIGTPQRDALEKQVEEAVQSYKLGEALKQARQMKQLTQAQLGEKVGVQKAQISRLENGKSITFSTLSRLLKALNIPAYIEMSGVGKVALW